MVVQAKERMIGRLGLPPVDTDSIRDFVSTYSRRLSLVLDDEVPRDGSCQQLRRRLGEQRQVVNLFEYATRTLFPAPSPAGDLQAA